MTNPLTIAFQPFATRWLGHTSRLIAIAQGIRRQTTSARLVFLAEGDPGPLLESAGFPHISLPPEATYAGPEWSDWPAAERDGMLGEMTRALLTQLQPRLIVFDSRPCTYIAEQSERLKLPTVLIARRTRTAERSLEWALAHHQSIDMVLVPHDPGEVPVPAELAEKTHFVGTIVRDGTVNAAELPRPDGRRVVITGGGGGFQGTVDFYNHAVAAVHAARARVPSLKATLVTGPMFREWQKLAPVEGVAIVPFDADLTRTMARADLVICQAGYNTMAELGELGTPTICVPAPRVADDQFARARGLMGQRKAFFVLTDSTVEAMADQIIACLETPRGEPVRRPAPAGADRAAQLILNLCP